jgi:hypothetical protein
MLLLTTLANTVGAPSRFSVLWMAVTLIRPRSSASCPPIAGRHTWRAVGRPRGVTLGLVSRTTRTGGDVALLLAHKAERQM